MVKFPENLICGELKPKKQLLALAQAYRYEWSWYFLKI